MITNRSNSSDMLVKTITPTIRKSFRSIIEEARQRIADGLDIDAQKAVEGNHQRYGANRFTGE